jgi:hypothetical protein
MNSLPSYVTPFLWSYNLDALDIQKNKKRIITNILNLGTKEATDWLFKEYALEDIVDAIVYPLPGEWNKKSLNFWALILNVTPGSTKREIK